MTDVKTTKQLLEENKQKEQEYLRRTAWFKSLSKPIEAFRPGDIKLNFEDSFQRDADPLKFLEVRPCDLTC